MQSKNLTVLFLEQYLGSPRRSICPTNLGSGKKVEQYLSFKISPYRTPKMFQISPYRTEKGIEFYGVYKMVAAEDGRNPNLEKDLTKLTFKNLIKSMNVGDRFHADDVHFIDHTEGEMYMEEFEYRVFNASYSKLGAALALDIKNIHVSPGSRVLYIGDRTCGVELSYLSDIVGINGHVYVVGFDEIIESVPDLFGCLKRRPNITILNNVTAKYPSAYANLAGQVDVIVSDVNDIDQAEILAYNARAILTEGGCFIAFNKNPVTVHVNYHLNAAVVPNETLQMTEIQKLRERGFQLMDSLTLEPYWEGWGCIVGVLPKK